MPAPTPEPVLDIFFPETHSSKLLGIADFSVYPVGWTISTPTVEITPPGWDKVSLPFVANSVQIINSDTLGITCNGASTTLPDGIYTIKYTISPAYKYFVEKSIFIVNSLYEQWDECWIKCNLSCGVSRTDRQILDGIECYIQGAIAAANKCANKMAYDLYNSALKALNNYLQSKQ